MGLFGWLSLGGPFRSAPALPTHLFFFCSSHPILSVAICGRATLLSQSPQFTSPRLMTALRLLQQTDSIRLDEPSVVSPGWYVLNRVTQEKVLLPDPATGTYLLDFDNEGRAFADGGADDDDDASALWLSDMMQLTVYTDAAGAFVFRSKGGSTMTWLDYVTEKVDVEVVWSGTGAPIVLENAVCRASIFRKMEGRPSHEILV